MMRLPWLPALFFSCFQRSRRRKGGRLRSPFRVRSTLTVRGGVDEKIVAGVGLLDLLVAVQRKGHDGVSSGLLSINIKQSKRGQIYQVILSGG